MCINNVFVFALMFPALQSNVSHQLIHWGRVTHICVSKLSIIGRDNGLSPGRRQAIIWTNDGILLIGPLGTNFSEILIEIQIFSLKENTFENVLCETFFISSQPQCVKIQHNKTRFCAHVWRCRQPTTDYHGKYKPCFAAIFSQVYWHISLWLNAIIIFIVQDCNGNQMAMTFHLWILVFRQKGPLLTPDSYALQWIVHEVVENVQIYYKWKDLSKPASNCLETLLLTNQNIG